jgi:hypothetical protein
MNVRNLTVAFNARFGTVKTERAISSALKNRGITCGRKGRDRLRERRLRIYTEAQIDFLRRNYQGRSLAQITDLFNLVFRDRKTVAQIKAAISNRGFTSGRTGRFEKGHKPWNHGTKGQGLTGRNKTSFTKGNRPPNRRRLGARRIDSKDGYSLVKVRETNPYTGTPTRFKPEHVHVWEKAHGPVPEGHVVMFRNGNNSPPIRLANLALVSRAEQLELNRRGYKDAPAELKPSIMATARLKVKAFGLQRKGGG